ncbi:SGNH family hydrolase [Moellerella wisconsensis]|uniref:SGNH/GDSL hydrolase family protein n=1 Tax=Moellerella wisconsensis TaxID=158849 RepID=UPI003076733C
MPISETTSEFSKNCIKAGQILVIVVIAGLLLIWLNQSSLERFWQQQYHRSAPWISLSGHPVWDYGAYLQEGALAAGEAFAYHASGQQAVDQKQQNQIAETATHQSFTFPAAFITGLHFINGYTRPATSLSLTFPELLNRKTSLPAINILLTGSPVHTRPIEPKTQVVLAPGDKVLFAGDSMMQGVAPHLKRMLFKNYGIDSLNLSKQSTGLAYPRFFNWPQTITNALENNPDIRLLVVFLGPNDPWDMPPDTGGKYVKFKSEAWELMYRQRINAILSTARQHNVDVIWIGPPNMKKNTLSEGMKYLRALYQSEVEQNGDIYLSTNDIFKYQDDSYSDYFGDGSSQIKLRSGDGIHFSLKGQQAISDQVFSFIKFKPQAEGTNETEQTASH